MILSIVVPCYNEEQVLPLTRQRLCQVAHTLKEEVEFLYVNDGSVDGTLEILKEMALQDPRVRVISFTRNFGHQAAVSAGLRRSRGDAVVIIDADLQDPPELIPRMLELWREGGQIVYGLRTGRQGESWFKKNSAKLFYRLLNRLSEVEIPLDTGDFRLVDKKVVQVFCRLPERNKYIRGLFAWMGFKQVPLEYQRDVRAAGETKYLLQKMLQLAGDGLLSFSRKPLSLALRLGFFTLLATLGLMIYVFIAYFSKSISVVPGWASTILTVLALGGVQLLSAGVLGAYIGRIYDESKGRPEYVEAEILGFPKEREL